MDPSLESGAARQYLRGKFGGYFSEQVSSPVCAAVAASMVVADPDRLGLLIVNLGANSAFFNFNGLVSATNGFQVSPNGGSVSLDVDEDFTLVTRELFGVSPGGNTQLYVLELVRDLVPAAPPGA